MAFTPLVPITRFNLVRRTPRVLPAVPLVCYDKQLFAMLAWARADRFSLLCASISEVHYVTTRNDTRRTGECDSHRRRHLRRWLSARRTQELLRRVRGQSTKTAPHRVSDLLAPRTNTESHRHGRRSETRCGAVDGKSTRLNT